MQQVLRREGGDPPALLQVARDLRDRAAAPVRVADLARRAGISSRTVYRAFARHVGAPPATWLRRARLEEVRKRLLEATPGDTVTAAALDWGFEHLGRFAGFYREQFGERPSDTLRRARAAGGAGSRPPMRYAPRPG